MDFYQKVKFGMSGLETMGLIKAGTIITPFPLIEEIVDKLPIQWDNPKLKFLDPACGRGAFLVVIAQRLLNAGHSSKHIIENMLYGIDIDRQNAEMTRQALRVIVKDTSGKYNNNIECTDALTKEFKMKFGPGDVILVNPPYDKRGDEPIYYDFMRWFATQTGATLRVIIPSGWLVGPKAKTFREFVLDNFNISNMQYITNEVFKTADGKILQPTLLIDAVVGTPTTEFTFARTAAGQPFSTKVKRTTDIFDLGMPLYINDLGKELITKAMQYSSHFETKTGITKGWCVNVGPANQSTYYLSTKPINWFVKNILVKILTSSSVSKKAQVRHMCRNQADADNLRHFMHSAAARLIMAQWATTYRNTGSNIGQIPAVIVQGEYSHKKAYKLLGLSKTTIEWLTKMECYDPNS